MSGIVLKIIIEDTHPPVWRRLVVPENISFYDLHRVIQLVFGWEDMHMHIFEAPQNRFEIVANSKDAYTDFFMEKKLPVSAVAEHENWIRYVYDMGDDWRHKIVFEKLLQDYEKDSATLMKTKGNNFVEDSGGIWGEEQVSGSYDAVSVNAQLEQLHFADIRLAEKDRKKLEQIYVMQQMDKEIKEMLKHAVSRPAYYNEIVPENRNYISKQSDSQADMEIFAWRQFCGEDEKGAICKMAPRKMSREILARLSDEELQNLEYALYIDEENVTDQSKEERILNMFQKHPEYYFCVLDETDMQEIAKVQSFEYNQKNEMNAETVEKGIALGLWHMQIPEKTQAAYLFPAIDFEQRLENFLNADWKDQILDMQDFSDKLRNILLAYVVIEQNAFYDIFEKQWNMKIEKKEFLRLVYLNGVIAGKYEIHAWHSTGERFISIQGMDMDAVLGQRMMYAADLSYKQFTKKELLKYNQPLGEINEQWMELEVIVHDFLWIPQDAMESFIIACYKDICSGYGIHAVLEHMGIHEIDLLLLHSCELWKTLMQIIMETRLPMLNGYSRLEYQNMTGKDAFSIGVFQEELLEDDVETETPLYAMPVSVQEMIYHALSDHRGADQIQALEQVTRKLKIHNDELDVLTAMACEKNEKYIKACNILEDVADRTEDPGVINTIDILCDQAERILENNAYSGNPFMDVQKEMPYQREAPKIGRNDPCPCGSGKKYKKCCGK